VERRIESIREFVAVCRTRRVEPVFVPAVKPAFEGSGLQLIPIGQTAHLQLPTFTLEGGARRSVRQSARRARREGLEFAFWTSPRRDELMRLRAVSDSWLSVRRLPERWFGTGRFEPSILAVSRVGVVTSRFGRVEAFVSLVEGYAPAESGVDLMRRRPDAPAGAMELLLSEVAGRLAGEGMNVLDLGLAPLSGLGDRWAERGLGWIFRNGSGLYDFKGLYRFKNKFRPRWEPRYLAITSLTALPRALLALSEIGTRRFQNRSLRDQYDVGYEGSRSV
jgi:phosphatidylglycerol lysyltransferase